MGFWGGRADRRPPEGAQALVLLLPYAIRHVAVYYWFSKWLIEWDPPLSSEEPSPPRPRYIVGDDDTHAGRQHV